MLCVSAATAAPCSRAAPQRSAGRRCAASPRPALSTCIVTRAPPRLRGPRPSGAFLRGLFPGSGDDASPPPSQPPPDEDAPPPWLTPPYTVVRATAVYELRVYGAYTAANTPYNQRRDEGLQRLAEYCDGANADEAALAALNREPRSRSPCATIRRLGCAPCAAHVALRHSLR